MYDRGTQTLWLQFLGEPAVGSLADTGIKLEVIPVVVTTWDEWSTAHPDTTVLDIKTGIYPPELYLPEGDPGSFYYPYRQNSDTMFPVSQRSNLLPTKAQVLGAQYQRSHTSLSPGAAPPRTYNKRLPG